MILRSCSCSPRCSLPDYQHGYVVFICGEFSNFPVITENLCAQFNSMNRMTNPQQGRRHRGDREAACLSCQVSQQSWDSSSSLMRQWAVLTFRYIRVQSSCWRFRFPSRGLTQPGISTVLPYLLGRQREGTLQGISVPYQHCCWLLCSSKEEQVCSSQTSRCVCLHAPPIFHNAAGMFTN